MSTDSKNRLITHPVAGGDTPPSASSGQVLERGLHTLELEKGLHLERNQIFIIDKKRINVHDCMLTKAE